jgi:hypothetical protein
VLAGTLVPLCPSSPRGMVVTGYHGHGGSVFSDPEPSLPTSSPMVGRKDTPNVEIIIVFIDINSIVT